MSFLSVSPSHVTCLTHLLLCPYDSLSLDFPVHTFLPYLLVLEARHAHLRTRTRSLAIWPSPPSTQVMSPTSSTRSLLWTVTLCPLTIQTSMKSLTSRKTHTRTLDCSVFSQCLNPLFRTFLIMILLFKKKAKKASAAKPMLDREKERKERGGFFYQCCIVDVKEKSTEQYEESFSSDSQKIPF